MLKPNSTGALPPHGLGLTAPGYEGGLRSRPACVPPRARADRGRRGPGFGRGLVACGLGSGTQRVKMRPLCRAVDHLGGYVIILGIILALLGFLLGVGVLWVIGIVLIVIGAILWILGAMGREIGGRRHYY